MELQQRACSGACGACGRLSPMHAACAPMQRAHAAPSPCSNAPPSPLAPPPRGFGTVRFTSREDAEASIEKLNNSDFEGRTITVRLDRYA